MCPTGTNPQVEQAVSGLGENDPDLEEYANAVATINPDECSASYLNNHVDITMLRGLRPVHKKQVPISELSKYQKIKSIKPILMNPACNSIYKSKYQELKKPTNTCNIQQSYTFQEWNSGYKLQVISRKQYLKLNENERYIEHLGSEYQSGADIVESIKLGSRIIKKYALHYKKIFINKKCWID